MTKKTLEEKIKNVGFWTFSFFAWYLVVAFFLKSNYPIYEYLFNRKDAYEVIKDALTLAASFLAPVAAFVLFSDWREQHNAVKNEKISEEIIAILNTELMPFLTLLPDELERVDKFLERKLAFHQLVSSLHNKSNEIRNIDEDSEKFTKIMSKVEEALFELWDTLALQAYAHREYNKIVDRYGYGEITSSKRMMYAEMTEQATNDNQLIYKKLVDQIKLLKPLKI